MSEKKDVPASGGIVFVGGRENSISNVSATGYTQNGILVLGEQGSSLSNLSVESSDAALDRQREESIRQLQLAIVEHAGELEPEKLKELLSWVALLRNDVSSRKEALGKLGQFAADMAGTAVGTVIGTLLGLK